MWLKTIRRERLMVLGAAIVLILIFGFWQKVIEVWAATQTKTFTYGASAESFAFTSGGKATGAFDGAVGNAAGAIYIDSTGRNNADTSYWEWVGTWEDFGVPAGGTVTQVRLDGVDSQVTAWNIVDAATIGPIEIWDNAGTPALMATLWSGRTPTGTEGGWTSTGAQSDQSVSAGYQASGSTIRLRLYGTIDNGNNAAATVRFYFDNVSFVATYTAASPTYTQNDFEWFETADSVTLTSVWPNGARDIAENGVIGLPVANDLLQSGDQIRLQMNFTVGTSDLSASSQRFQLQYVAAEDCTTATGWAAVGAKASGTIWRLFDETSIGDSTAQVNNISTSTSGAEGYYSEINASGTAVNPNAVTVGQSSEWDWPLENNGAAASTTYCFRMVKHDGVSTATAFDTYNADSYPKLTTAPDTGNLLRHGNFFAPGEKGFFWAN